MNKSFGMKSNSNFYYLKELQWANKAAKKNLFFNTKRQQQQQDLKIDPILLKKEQLWDNRFIYSKPNTLKHKDYSNSKLYKKLSKNTFYSMKRSQNPNNNSSSPKINIRGKMLKSIYKSSSKSYLDCSFKNTYNSKIISHKASYNNHFLNKSNNYSNNLPPLDNDIINTRFLYASPCEKNKYKNNNNNNKIIQKSNTDELTKLWDDLCIKKPYRELFNLVLKQLDKKRKDDIYQREIYELTELKNKIQYLSSNIYYRLKTLEDLYSINDKLGLMIKSKNTNSNEIFMKKISKKIQKLREYTINLCFSFQSIKEKLNAGHPWGKYNIEKLEEKYKFDINYLIKMKDEMKLFKEGYIKYFFNIQDDQTPFLLSSSKIKNYLLLFINYLII